MNSRRAAQDKGGTAVTAKAASFQAVGNKTYKANPHDSFGHNLHQSSKAMAPKPKTSETHSAKTKSASESRLVIGDLPYPQHLAAMDGYREYKNTKSSDEVITEVERASSGREVLSGRSSPHNLVELLMEPGIESPGLMSASQYPPLTPADPLGELSSRGHIMARKSPHPALTRADPLGQGVT